MKVLNGSAEAFRPEIKCKVCGSSLYSTDWGCQQTTYHCSSADARFWDFDRGTAAQARSKEHWDQSREEIYTREDLHATG